MIAVPDGKRATDDRHRTHRGARAGAEGDADRDEHQNVQRTSTAPGFPQEAPESSLADVTVVESVMTPMQINDTLRSRLRNVSRRVGVGH